MTTETERTAEHEEYQNRRAAMVTRIVGAAMIATGTLVELAGVMHDFSPDAEHAQMGYLGLVLIIGGAVLNRVNITNQISENKE